MLLAFSEMIINCDPDIILGYNIINFDLPYLIGRVNHFEIEEKFILGRLLGKNAHFSF